MVDGDAEGELYVGRAVGAGFAGKVNGNLGLRLRILSVIGPGRARGFLHDFCGFEGNWRIAGAFEAFRALHAETETPSGVASLGDKKNWIVARLSYRRSDRSFSLRRL